MTDDINNYTFDFQTEAEALRRKLPSRGKNVVFAETRVAQPGGPDTPVQVKLLQLIGNGQFMDKYLPLINEWVTWLYNKDPNDSSQVSPPFIEEDGKTVSHVIAIREQEYGARMLGNENNALMRLFILYHETAHVLIPGASADKNHPYREAAADAFAALLFLQRFGPEAKDFLSKISWNRTFEAVRGDTTHLSTIVLDKIIVDSDHQDFSKLNAAEMAKLAETYAKQWTPPVKAISAARAFFKRNKSLRYSELLQESLASPSASIAYIGAKFFQPFLHPQGAILNGQKRQLDDTARQAFADAIDERAEKTTLHDIFRKAKGLDAETPIAALLKVIHPGNQHAFIANF